MQALLYILFVSVFLLDYLANVVGAISTKFTLLPEFLSGIALLVIVLEYSKTRNINIDGKYLIFFFLFSLNLLNGIIVNDTTSGAIVAGLRVYMKYIPFFLLPMVFDFSAKQVRSQLQLLFVLLLAQLPVALLQRFVIFRDVPSGDVVRGTLLTSSFLSIVLICGIAMLQAFYLKKRITLLLFFVLLIMLFIPTTLNETKGTIILLPIALLVPILTMKRQKGEKSKLLPGLLIAGFLYIAFQMAYDHIMVETIQKNRPSIAEFFTDPDKLKHYLAPRSFGMVRGDEGPIGRIDRLVYPLVTLSEDPVKLFVGLGMGSVTKSAIGKLSGNYMFYRTEGWVGGGISYLLWETGIIGVIFSVGFLFMILMDSMRRSRSSEYEGALALGWGAITCIVGISLFYKDIIPVNAIMYPFWYFSGYIISSRVRTSSKSSYGYKRENVAVAGGTE